MAAGGFRWTDGLGSSYDSCGGGAHDQTCLDSRCAGDRRMWRQQHERGRRRRPDARRTWHPDARCADGLRQADDLHDRAREPRLRRDRRLLRRAVHQRADRAVRPGDELQGHDPSVARQLPPHDQWRQSVSGLRRPQPDDSPVLPRGQAEPRHPVRDRGHQVALVPGEHGHAVQAHGLGQLRAEARPVPLLQGSADRRQRSVHHHERRLLGVRRGSRLERVPLHVDHAEPPQRRPRSEQQPAARAAQLGHLVVAPSSRRSSRARAIRTAASCSSPGTRPRAAPAIRTRSR